MIIGFSGTDASGKTTISKLMVERFLKRNLKVEYHHFNEKFLLKPLFELLNNRTKEALNVSFFNGQKRTFKLWPLAQFLDSLAYLFYCKIFKRDRIIIWDRYPPDSIPVWKYTGYCGSFIESLYLSFPNPDIAILLYVPPKVAYERGKTTHVYDINFYHFQTKKLFEIAKKYKTKIIVKSDRPVKETFEEIYEIVKETL